MTLRQIQYLVALADTGHFGRAAERCCATQSTLSLQIRRLEDYLGVQLFDRRRRAVCDSGPAREIVALGRRMLFLADEIRRVAEAARAPGAGGRARLEGSIARGRDPDVYWAKPGGTRAVPAAAPGRGVRGGGGGG